jgi:hypothetical protein
MSSNESTKLLLTAVGAAIAGAGMAVAVLKYSPARYSAPKDEEPSFPPLQQKRTSFIYENNASSSNSVIFPHNHEERMRRQITARAAVEEDNFMPRDSVTVRVPATSANMGPGYDTIGMAVDLWSEVTVERADTFEITAEGEGATEMPKDETNYMVIGCKAAFEAANKPLPILKYHVFSRVPFARGLGSSSAAIVAGIIAGLILAGHRLPCWGSEALLQIAAGIEVRARLSAAPDTTRRIFSFFAAGISSSLFCCFSVRDIPITLLPSSTVAFRWASTMVLGG